MIPKIIHYCWLSNDPIPSNLQKCMQSWKKYLPAYEFMLWNLDRPEINASIWVQEAFQAKKYAFAADYVRCYALYHQGGIYLDMDVEVLKSFDDLLHLPYFIGKEDLTAAIEAAVMGAEKNHVLFQKLLDHYRDRHFVLADNHFDMVTLPRIIRSIITENFNAINISSVDDFVDSPQTISIFPVDWFSPKSYKTGKINTTPNTYTIHHFAGSWFPLGKRVKKSIIRYIVPRLTRIFVKIKSFFHFGDRF